MKLVKGKISFIRSILGCFIFPLLIGYFYTYLNPAWFMPNEIIGLILGLLFLIRGYFEVKIANNIRNGKFSYICGGITILYVILRSSNLL